MCRPHFRKFAAGGLKSGLHTWRRIGASETVLNWIEHGVTIPFTSEPDTFEYNNRKFSAREALFIDKELSELLKTGAVKCADQQPHCVSPLNVVPKKGGKLRLIIDLRHLNAHCEAPSFVYEDINTVLQLVSPGDQLVTFDIKSGFHHVPIAPESQSYLGFQWRGKFYYWCVLPFGLNISPFVFCKILRPVVSYLRNLGLKLVIYVDDGILGAKPNVIIQHRDTLLDLFYELGWCINLEKSFLEPDTSRDFIGYVVSTANADNNVWVKIPRVRIASVRRDISRALNQGAILARALARIAGKCVSMAKAVLPAKLLLRNIYRLLKSRQSWQDRLLLDPGTIQDLTWWHAALDAWNGRAVRNPAIDAQLTTDASSIGWGATCGTQEAQGLWNAEVSQKSSNYRELKAIFLALRSFLPKLRNKTVQVLTDNITATAYINFQGGPSVELTGIAKEIWECTLENNISISAKYLAGRLNVEADWLSRLQPHYEWKLHPGVFRYLDRMWGRHTIDRFASLMAHHVDTYNSRYADPGTHGIDALAQTNWATHNNFVNPPFRLLPRVVSTIAQQQATATVIAPMWPGQIWYQKLKEMSVVAPVRLPRGAVLPLTHATPEPLRNRRWKLFAWRVSGTSV